MSNSPDEIRDQRDHGWYWIDKRLVQRDGVVLGVSAIAVYNILSSYANNNTQQAFPGIRRMAKLFKMSPTTVRESIEKLELNGWIKVESRTSEDNKGHEAHIYTLLSAPAPATVLLPSRKESAPATVTDQSSSNNPQLKDSPAPPEKPKKERHQDLVLNTVVHDVFEVPEMALLDNMVENGWKRAAKISSWLKKFESDIDPQRVTAFCAWYREKYQGISIPRDLGKFQEHWVVFAQGGSPQDAVPAYTDYGRAKQAERAKGL